MKWNVKLNIQSPHKVFEGYTGNIDKWESRFILAKAENPLRGLSADLLYFDDMSMGWSDEDKEEVFNTMSQLNPGIATREELSNTQIRLSNKL